MSSLTLQFDLVLSKMCELPSENCIPADSVFLQNKPNLVVKSNFVLVLAGGWSDEREISLETGENVLQGLKELGHQVVSIDPDRNLEIFLTQIKDAFSNRTADVIFNCLHGKWGEDGTVQGVLESLRIPYTSSGVLASALAMNKKFSRTIAEALNVCTPLGQVVTIQSYKQNGYSSYPHIIKCLCGGSSIGVHYVKNEDEFLELINRLEDSKESDKEILVENYIPGRELSVSVLNGEAIGVLELCFKGPIFNYDSKYSEGRTEHIVPAPVPQVIYNKAMDWASKMHVALNCQGATRSDFRYNDTQESPGNLYYLETNTQPGLTKLSILPETALKLGGWEFPHLVQWMLENAMGKPKD